MNYGKINHCDAANGLGVRVSIFVSGCRNHCKGCFQPETWNFKYGEEWTPEVEDKVLELLAPAWVAGLSVLGGEPFEPENQRVLVPFLRRVKETYPHKTIWVWTGFTMEELKTVDNRGRCEVTDSMFELIDVLVDGRFVQEKKDITLAFRGSSNQRIIDTRRRVVIQNSKDMEMLK